MSVSRFTKFILVAALVAAPIATSSAPVQAQGASGLGIPFNIPSIFGGVLLGASSRDGSFTPETGFYRNSRVGTLAMCVLRTGFDFYC